ncbi:MAG: c-type cytochrome [Alphaproteobacteria bacterium]
MDSMKLNKLAAAILLAGVVAMTTGFVSRLIHPAAGGGHGAGHDEKRVLAGYVKADAGSDHSKPAKPAGPEPVAGLLAAADIAAGQKLFKKCKACHTAAKDGPNKVGPALFGVVGNDIASHGGYSYSKTLQGLPGNWDYASLNKFLFKPKVFAKGTKMAFAGLSKASDRAAIIAYLRAQDDTPEPLPAQ